MNRKKMWIVAGLGLALAGAVVVAPIASAHGPFGGRGGGMLGGWGGGADHETEMAEALGTSVDALRAAQDKVFEARVAKAVENGALTAEQADTMRAGRKLQRAIDKDALVAEALGISAADLAKAREDGTTQGELLEERDIDPQAFREKLQAAREAAVAKAVADGVVTQEQADALKDQGCGGKMGGGMGGAMFGRHGGFRERGIGGPGMMFGRGRMAPGAPNAPTSPDAPTSPGARWSPVSPSAGSTDL